MLSGNVLFLLQASAIIRMVQHLVFKNDNSFHDAIRVSLGI